MLFHNGNCIQWFLFFLGWREHVCLLRFVSLSASLASLALPFSFDGHLKYWILLAEKESKHHASSLTIAKVPRSYVPRSITPPPALPRATKKSEQEAEDGCKPHIRASSIPRPRAVISSPDNDQILGSKNKKRLERPSPLTNHNMAQSRHSTPRRHSENRRTPIITARKTSTRTAESRETVHISDAKGKQGSGVDIRVPRANIVKAKPCFTIT